MKHKTLTITYYHSNLIEEMLFSIESVKFNIEHDMFVDHLEGDYSEKLIEASERMVDGYNGTTADDCYKLPLLYIFNEVYGKYYK